MIQRFAFDLETESVVTNLHPALTIASVCGKLSHAKALPDHEEAEEESRSR